MKNIKYFILFLITVGCSHSSMEQVRIVDSNGKPAKINKIIPKFNEEQLIKQREAFNSDKGTNPEMNKFRHDYNNTGQPINKNTSSTFTMSDQNIMIPVKNKYPNDIFADRITNYNYIQDEKNVIQNNAKSNNKKTVDRKEIINNINNEIIEGDIVDTKTGKKIEEKDINKTKIADEKLLLTTQPKNLNNKTPTTKNNSNQKQYYIQIGIYTEKKNADNAYNKYSKISSGSIEEYNTKNNKKYKVLLGPYSNKKLAEQNLEKVIKTGHYDVYITEKK